MNCNISGIVDGCGMSVGGIKEVFLLPFGDLRNLKFQDNDVSYVIDYQLLSIPKSYDVGKNSSFQSTANTSEVGVVFTHDLTMEFSGLDPIKRAEFERLKNSGFSAFVKTNNGICLILGDESPLFLENFTKTTDIDGGNDGYKLNFSCKSSKQALFSKCFSSECFATLVGSELTSGAFLIENASTFSGIFDLEIVADGNLLSFTTANPLSPLNWNVPATNAADLATLQALVGTFGTVFGLFYDSVADEAFFFVQSQGVVFDYAKLSTANPYRSTSQTELNLQVLQGGTIINGIISVSDSFGSVLYSGLAGDPITGVTGISGTVANSTLIVSDLYAQSVTFSAEITGTACDSGNYQWVYTPQASCEATFAYGVSEGRSYSVTFPKYGYSPTIRRMKFHYDGFVGEIFPIWDDSTDSLAVFEAAFRNMVTNWGADIDLNTLSITDNGTTITILFTSANNDADFFVKLFGNDLLQIDDARYQPAFKTVLADFQTVTNQTTIGIQQGGDLIEGQNGQIPTTINGFFVEDDPANPFDGISNNISAAINAYNESQNFGRYVDSSFCPRIEALDLIETCDFGRVVYREAYFYRLEFQALTPSETELGGVWSFYNGGSFLFQIAPSVVNPTTYDSLSFEFGQLGADYGVVDFQYDVDNQTFILDLAIPSEHPLLSIDANGHTFSLQFYDEISCVKFNNTLHPAINLGYTIPTLATTMPVLTGSTRIDGPIFYLEKTKKRSVFLSYDGVSGDLNLDLRGNDAINGNWEIDFYDNFPALAPPILSYSLPVSVTSVAFDSDLAASGRTVNDVAFVVASNSFLSLNATYVPSVNTDIELAQSFFQHFVWGRGQHFCARSTDTSAFLPSLTINSVNCGSTFLPSDFGGNLLLWNRPESQTYIWDFVGTVAVSSGATSYTTANTSKVVAGGLVSFDGGTTHYVIASVVASTVNLTSPIVENGAVDERTARVASLHDDSTYSRTQTGVGGSLLYIQNVNGGFGGVHMDTTSHYQISPITYTNPNSLNLIALCKPIATGAEILLAHRSSTNALLQFNIEQGTKYGKLQMRSSSGGTVQTASATANIFSNFNIYSWDFVQGVGVNDTFSVWNNGDYANKATASANLAGDFSATVELIGSYYSGSGTFGGFAGAIQELIVTDGLALSDVEKLEGYLAWKYSLQSQLPASHPYRYTAP